ncbi:calcium-binding protein [Acinetobacter oleivorans]|uniref:calcium-binding protein n=1 Tax=Acinetobacter oleivorans TaxID=1148157 RepID=UPI00148EEF81|nr:calcium-binding protein [Acinetobacter oleivorans]
MKTYNEIITELSNANASGYIYSLNELHDLVSQASGSLSDNTTLTSYYSGSAFLDQDVSTGLYQESISVNSYGEIGRISQTDVSRLAENIAFLDALENTLNSMGVIDSDQFNKEGTAAYEFWNGSGGIDPSTGEYVPSIWNTISEVYARDTKGDVLALVPFADDNRIWAQTELPTLLDNPNVTSINGIPIDELRTNLQSNGYNQVFEDIKTQSVLIMSEFQYVRDTSTGRIAAVDTGQVLSKYFGVEDVTIDPFITIQNPTYEIRPQYEAYGYSEIYNSQLGLIRETHIQNSPYLTDIQKSHFLEVAGKTGGVLGSALTVLGLIALSSQVQAAETSEQKQQIIDDWVAHTTAEWIAGSIGSALVVGGVAAFTAISAPVTLGLAIVGGIVGSIVGGDTVYELIKEGVNKVLSDIKSNLHSIVGEFLDQFDLNDVMGLYEQAEHVTSPLILDLNKDGVVGTRALSENIYFDHDGSGFKEKTGWVSSQDGLLVLDKNNNADIEIGNELFGNQTSLNNGQLAKNGFEALADYDLNNDGVIDAEDEIYQQLQVWQDFNQNAHVDQGELNALQTIGIQQIDLVYTSAKEVDVNGNHHKQQGQFIWADGTAGKIDDVWFQADTLHSQINQAQIVEIDHSIAVLPDIHQFGNVDSLHQAMAKDTKGILQQLVEQFVQTDSLLVRQQLVADIIYQWTGVADLPSHERGMYWDDLHLLALEKIMGRQYHSFADRDWTLAVGNNQAFALEEAWRVLRQKIYDQLYLQQKAPEIFEKIQISESNELDVTQLYSYIKQYSLIEVAELYDVLSRGPQLFKDVQNSLKQLALKVSTPDLIDQILGQTLQVHISSLNDSFYVGSDGDDLLISNIGADIFVGGEGVNIYVFSSNSGQDIIQASYLSENSPLTETHILLDALPQDIVVEFGSSDIILKISGTEDQLKIENAISKSSIFKTITFADQTVWTITDILAQPLLGTEGDDYLVGIDARDNKIYGFAGNDNLYGAIGNDYLDGGTGDDYLDGGYGINTYYFDRGYANDVIIAPYLTPESAPTETHIQLGILPDDISVELFDQSIRIRIKDSGDTLEIHDAFVENSAFKTITFADQNVWTITDILAQPLLGTENDDYLVGIDVRDNKIYGFAGDDYLYGSIGNDYLDGGTGDDELNGGDGINTYVFNRGYGYDLINTPYLDENSPQIETHILMDVLPSDVSVEVSYQDVFISLNNTDDLLEIRGVFAEFSAFKTITFTDQTVWTIQDLQNSASMDSNQNESLTDLLNGLADNSNYEEYGYLFDELPDNQSLVGQLEGNNTQVLTDSVVLEESSDVDYQLNLLTIEDVQKSDIDVDKLLIITNANSDSEDSQNIKNILTQKYQLDEVDDQIVFDNTSFSMPNNIGLWNTSFNQQFIA